MGGQPELYGPPAVLIDRWHNYGVVNNLRPSCSNAAMFNLFYLFPAYQFFFSLLLFAVPCTVHAVVVSAGTLSLVSLLIKRY